MMTLVEAQDMTTTDLIRGEASEFVDSLGTDAAATLPVVHVQSGLPGFPSLTRFVLVSLDADGVVQELRSIEDDSVAFIVVPSVAFFPDYAPEIDDSMVQVLSITDSCDVVVLLVVTLGETLASTTANLMAPIVVNTTSLLAAQVVLDDSYPLRAPLAAD